MSALQRVVFFLFFLQRVVNMYESMISLVETCRLCIKPGIQERRTECGNGGNVIFRGMSPNIPGNIVKHSGECS